MLSEAFQSRCTFYMKPCEINALFDPGGSSLAIGGCRYMVVSSSLSALSVPQDQREIAGTVYLPLRDRDAFVATSP